MADTFADLLSSIGFGGADAAQQEGIIGRKADLAKSNIGIQAGEDRQALSAGYEGRGVYGSGEALLGNARLESKISNQMTGVDIATADETQALQRQLQRDQAQKEADDRAFNLQIEMAQKQYDLQKQQIADGAASQKRQEDAYNAYIQSGGGRNY